MGTASTEVTSIQRQNDIEKSTWRTHWYFVDFKSRIHVEISTSNRCHNFQVDSLFKIDLISTNFPRGIWTSNRWRIDEDVSIGLYKFLSVTNRKLLVSLIEEKIYVFISGFLCFYLTSTAPQNNFLELSLFPKVYCYNFSKMFRHNWEIRADWEVLYMSSQD